MTHQIRAMEVLFRFIVPVGGILFFCAALIALLSGVCSPARDQGFQLHFIIVAVIGLSLSVAGLILLNFTRFRHKWRDFDQQTSGIEPTEIGNSSEK